MRIVLDNVYALVATVVVAFTFSAAQSPAGPASSGRVSVVASFYPLYEFTRRVGGDRVSVRTLVPAGVESHDYEPTPRDVVRLTQARVIVYSFTVGTWRVIVLNSVCWAVGGCGSQSPQAQWLRAELALAAQ
ncbi:MAG: metal ABC transporter solute-binding protein, Zn/Mn family, partial [Armatimonadota bacterium]